MTQLANRLRAFYTEQRGSVILLVAGVIFVLVMFCGAVIDFGMARILQNKLQQASVAAILSGSHYPKDATDSDIAQNARKYFALNFTDDYLGSSITPADVQVDVTRNAHNVASVRVHLSDVKIRTVFLDALGSSQTSIRHSNQGQIRAHETTDSE